MHRSGVVIFEEHETDGGQVTDHTEVIPKENVGEEREIRLQLLPDYLYIFWRSPHAVLSAEDPAIPIGACKKEKEKEGEKQFEDESEHKFVEGK